MPRRRSSRRPPSWRNLKNWGALEFNEKIVFAQTGAIDVLDDLNHIVSTHTGNVHPNWEIIPNDLRCGRQGIGAQPRQFDLSATCTWTIGSGAVVDLAGNAAVITGITEL